MGQQQSFDLTYVKGKGWANNDIILHAPDAATFGGPAGFGPYGGKDTVQACFDANPQWAVGSGKEYKCYNGSVLNSGDTAWFVSSAPFLGGLLPLSTRLHILSFIFSPTLQFFPPPSFQLTSSALVLFMSVPGLALYYSGLVRQANVLTTAMQTLSICCFITFMWMAFGYSLAFAPTNPYRKTSTPIYGDGSRLWFRGMKYDTTHFNAPSVPEACYCMYQLTFALITPALICGSFADRMKYWPMVVFMCLWHIVVYCPIAHASWHPDGFLYQAGVLDFAGGNVVHIASGVAGLVSVAIVGNRRGFNNPLEKENFSPNNIMTTFTGAMMLWVGWFGFNGCSGGTAGMVAGQAVLNTHVSACMGGLSWMLIEVIFAPDHLPKFLGMISGVISGLVAITPGAGFVDQNGALWTGVFAGSMCYFGAQLKHYLGYDDALDAFGVHAIGGIIGGISVGFFATQHNGGGMPGKFANAPGVNNRDGVYYSNMTHGGHQLAMQIYGIVVSVFWSAFASAILLLTIDKVTSLISADGTGLRVSAEHEDTGLDASIHGESLGPAKIDGLEMVPQTETC